MMRGTDMATKMNTGNAQSMAKNFEFPNMITKWKGYVSSLDKTNTAEDTYVQGSQNIYKKLSGNLAVRQGQKRIGAANNAQSPVSSEFIWYTSWGQTYPVWISNSLLQVMVNDVWYTLLSGLTQTRYVFDKWWDDTEKKDRLLFVKGDSDIQSWSGGFTTIASGTAPVSGAITSGVIVAGGTSYITGDIITISGGGGSGGTFSVTASAGIVTDLTELTPGSGYSGTTGAATTGGSGSGLTVTITVGTAGTLTKQGTSSWFDSGFATNLANEKKIMINGTEYTYVSGENGTTLFGVTPNPSAIVAGTVAIQSVITTIGHPATSGFSNDFIKVINNRLYVGSYTSRLIYISSNTDYTDFALVPAPTPVGSPNLLTLDSTGKGIGVKDGNPYIGYGTSSWMSVTFPTFTDSAGALYEQITPNIYPVANLAAPLAHEFIDNSGNNIVYLSQDQQLRELGNFNNLFVTGFPSLSQDVFTEFSAEDFTGGGVRCIGDFTYITSPDSGKTYLYQTRQSVNDNTVTIERLWHSPFILGATRIDEINGVVVSFSNANPQVYEVWDTGQWFDDSPSEEPLPYSCILALAYRSNERRQGLQSFDKTFSEGYFSLGTPLDLTINYNWLGATGQVIVPVNSVQRPGYIFSPSFSSLGDDSLGDKPLGDDIIDESISMDLQDLSKFKVINSLSLLNCFEYQLIYSSDAANAQWELLASATNAVIEPDQDTSFIINKKPL